MLKSLFALIIIFFGPCSFAGTYCVSVKEYSSAAKAVRTSCFGESNIDNFTVETGSNLFTSFENDQKNIELARVEVRNRLSSYDYSVVGVFEDYEVFQKNTEILSGEKTVLLVESPQNYRFFLSGGWEKHTRAEGRNDLIDEVVKSENLELDAIYQREQPRFKGDIKFLERRVGFHETGFLIYKGPG